MRIGIRSTAAVLLVLSLGLHWVLLQTVAWTGMVIVNSQTLPFREAVSRALDGEHPCPLCTAIQKGKQEESKQQQETSLKPKQPPLLGLTWEAEELDFWCERLPMIVELPAANTRVEAPPKPHPRPVFPGYLPWS